MKDILLLKFKVSQKQCKLYKLFLNSMVYGPMKKVISLLWIYLVRLLKEKPMIKRSLNSWKMLINKSLWYLFYCLFLWTTNKFVCLGPKFKLRKCTIVIQRLYYDILFSFLLCNVFLPPPKLKHKETKLDLFCMRKEIKQVLNFFPTIGLIAPFLKTLKKI